MHHGISLGQEEKSSLLLTRDSLLSYMFWGIMYQVLFYFEINNYYLKTFYQLHYYFFFFKGIGVWKGREKGWRPNSNVAKSVAGEQNEISGIGLIKGDKVWSLLQGSPSEAWWFKAADCQFGPHPCATEDLPLFLGFIFGNILKHNVFSPYSIATLLHTR